MSTNTIADKFSKVTNADQAASVVKTLGGQYKRHLETGDSKYLDAAYATWQAVKFDLILEGRKSKDSQPVRWSHEEYSNLYDGGSGAAKTNVGVWIVLGYALVVLELSPDSDLMKRLRKGVQFSPVKAKVRATKNTPEDKAELATFVDKFVDENGRKRDKADRIERGSGETATATPDDGSGTGNGNGSETPEKVEVTEANAAAVMKDVIRLFALSAKHLDDVTFTKAVNGISDKIRAEKASRAKAAKKAAAKGA